MRSGWSLGLAENTLCFQPAQYTNPSDGSGEAAPQSAAWKGTERGKKEEREGRRENGGLAPS